MSVSGNISIDKTQGRIDLTKGIKMQLDNFGPGWMPEDQALGRLYVKRRSGTVHP